MIDDKTLQLNYTVESIIDAVCGFIKVDKEDFLGTNRDRLLVDARRIAINIITCMLDFLKCL